MANISPLKFLFRRRKTAARNRLRRISTGLRRRVYVSNGDSDAERGHRNQQRSDARGAPRSSRSAEGRDQGCRGERRRVSYSNTIYGRNFHL